MLPVKRKTVQNITISKAYFVFKFALRYPVLFVTVNQFGKLFSNGKIPSVEERLLKKNYTIKSTF